MNKVDRMHVEIIGSTSAGKTTLAKKMVNAGKTNGVEVYLSDDYILKKLNLNWVKNDFIRRRLVEIVAFGIYLTCLPRYKEFLSFVIREGLSSPGSFVYKFNRIRNVIRKIGIFEFISRNSRSKQIILADNEGILQGVHNLFVHQNSQANLPKITKYVDLIPLPDIVLYLQQEEEILVTRTLGRGHARLAGSSTDEVVHFIRQAIAVFNEMINIPKIRARLLIVDGRMKIQREIENSFDDNIHLITELFSTER